MAKAKWIIRPTDSLDLLKLNDLNLNKQRDKSKIKIYVSQMKQKAWAVNTGMILSKELQAIKMRSGGRGVKVNLSRKLAQELLSLMSNNHRSLNSNYVWCWAFMYYSDTVKLHYSSHQEIFILDGVTNELLDGGHRLEGFLSSGRKQIKAIITFSANGLINTIL